jgi:hypothetical protein
VVKKKTLVLPRERFQRASDFVELLKLMHPCSFDGPMTVGCMPDDWWEGVGKLAWIIGLEKERIVFRLGAGGQSFLSANDGPPEWAREVRRLCNNLEVGDQVVVDDNGIRLAPTCASVCCAIPSYIHRSRC